MVPLRRLITSGGDTPENKALLFGPSWEAGTARLHKEIRLQVLTCPPLGSPGHMVAGYMEQGSKVWRLRGPSAEEAETIRRVGASSQIEE